MQTPKEQRKVHGERNSAGVAYTFIPEGVDRDDFVRNAMRTNSLKLVNGFSEVLDNVRAPKHVLNEIEWPRNTQELGSMILWVNVKPNNQPVAVTVIPKGNEVYDILENQFELRRSFKDTQVDVSGDAEKGILMVNVFSKSNSPRILLNASSPNGDAVLEARVAGDVTVDAQGRVQVSAGQSVSLTVRDLESEEEKEATISYVIGEGFSYSDEFGNEITLDDEKLSYSDERGNLIEASDGQVKVKGEDNVVLGEGEEPMVLGSKLGKFLDEFVGIVSGITVATSIGTQPIINKAQAEALKQKVDTIKSEYSKTD